MAGKQILGGRPKTSCVWEYFTYDIEKKSANALLSYPINDVKTDEGWGTPQPNKP